MLFHHNPLLDRRGFRWYPKSMPLVNCKQCSKSFKVKPNRIKRGWGKYCSRECQFADMHNGQTFACATCGNSVYRTPKEQRSSRSGRFYCNKSCFAKWKNKLWAFGEDHFNWKDGEASYRNAMLRSKKKPQCSGCKNNELRVLVVHHIDENRKNNDLKNLQWLCRNCHYLIHAHIPN